MYGMMLDSFSRDLNRRMLKEKNINAVRTASSNGMESATTKAHCGAGGGGMR